MSFLRLVRDGDNEHYALAERLRSDTGLDFEIACLDDHIRLTLRAPSGAYWFIELEKEGMDQEGAYWAVRQSLSLPLDGTLQDILKEVGYDESPPDREKAMKALIAAVVVLVVALGAVLLWP